MGPDCAISPKINAPKHINSLFPFKPPSIPHSRLNSSPRFRPNPRFWGRNLVKMTSKKEVERNEKIVRGLMKLPHNRNCINCNSLGPQYVCTSFSTFVCTICSGIHREFTHRVKSISMSNFTKQEVEALQRGGNQCAKEVFLKDWDTQQMRPPDISNPDKIRAFIRDVYLYKKYAGKRSSDMPSRDIQKLKNHEEERRRASSFHLSSQGPSYGNQYDGRYCRRQTGRDLERKAYSFRHSSGHLQEQIYDDRSASESSGSRTSDYSMSSAGGSFRYDGQSSSFHDIGHTFPRLNQRTASSSSFGSFDSNSASSRSVNSGNIVDIVQEPEHSISTKHTIKCMLPSFSLSAASVEARNQESFHLPSVHQPMTSLASPLDLFADYNNQASTTISPEKIPSLVPVPQNDGWITFESPEPMSFASTKKRGESAVVRRVDEEPKMPAKAIPAVDDYSKWFSVQRSVLDGSLLTLTEDAMLAVVRHVDEAPQMPEDAIPSVDDKSKWFSVQSSVLDGSLLTLTKDAIPDVVHRVDEAPKMPEDAIPAVDDNSKWRSVQHSRPDGPLLTLTGDAIPAVVRCVDEAPKMTEYEMPAVDDNSKWFSVQRSMLDGSLLTLTEDAIPAMVRCVDETPKMPEDAIPAVDDSSKWFSVQRSMLDGSLLTLTGQGHGGLQLDRSPEVLKISQSSNVVDDSNGKTSQISFASLTHDIEPHNFIQKSQMVVNQPVGLKVPEGYHIDGNQMLHVDCTNFITESSFPRPVTSLTEGAAQVRKSTNPFEYDSDSEANNVFLPWMDISSSHAALPDHQWPTAQYGGSNAPWPPDTSFSNFYPSVNQGGLAYMAQSSHPLNAPPKSPQDSRGGNPFA